MLSNKGGCYSTVLQEGTSFFLLKCLKKKNLKNSQILNISKNLKIYNNFQF